MSVIEGKVVRIVKCIPVAVKYSKSKKCYLQLPVFRENTPFPFFYEHIYLKNPVSRQIAILSFH